MASEDVIELGSSDDELEPAPKRAKPRPNAMVHIPTNLHGITIKPTSSKVKQTSSKVKPTSSKVNIPVKKAPQKLTFAVSNSTVHNVTNQFVKSKPNGKTVQNPQTKKQNVAVNPVSLIQKLSSQHVVINKIPPGPKLLRNPIHINSPQTINKLPPGISVTRSPSTLKPVHSVPAKRLGGIQVSSTLMKKQKLSVKAKPIGEVLTVELDDDDTSTSSTANPQWYLRPEQQDNISMKNKNNKEPETSNLVEITIEDSPIKPKSMNADQVKDLLAVTIDDSPVKVVMADKNSDATASDEEDCTSRKVPNSKKKLEYPKEAGIIKTIEIEIEPVPQIEVPTELPVKCVQSKVKPFPTDIIVEIEDSPIKTVDVMVTTPKKDDSHEKLKIPDTSKISDMQVKNKSDSGEVKISDTSKIRDMQVKNKSDSSEVKILDNSEVSNMEVEKTQDTEVKILEEKSNVQVENKQESSDVKVQYSSKTSDIQAENKVESECSEFHPIYQSFIDLCFKLENSEDMKKIVEKKVKAYYRQCPKEYTESEEFLDMVSGKILSMKAGPEKMYLYMKDIVDELNLQRKMAKSQVQTTINVNKESEKQMEKEAANFLYGEDSEFDTKRKRQIRKLEKTLKKLHRAIQKLEEQEVDFDDEEDSVYLLTERYKERMVRVHAKFCQLTNTKMPSEPRVQIDPRPGQPAGPAKRLEKWINKKVPIGTPLPFPDFHDVLRCVREANDEDKLGWNEADIMEEARDLFTRCGSKLQRRRQENEWRSAVSRISLDVDPAENNEELKRKLENNRQEANKKVSELLNKYADKQNQLKLEGTEIGDKEAEESPVESEEEEVVEEVPLENKNKRKELLRRLLQEKSRKSIDQKENLPNSQNELEIAAVDDINLESTTMEPAKDFKEVENTEDSKKHIPGEEENKENSNKDNSQKQVVNDDDEYKIESDIDELHLLQKLHSENEVNSSTLESSGSDSPIAISDSFESSNEDVKQMSDVISIENSSYSESEMNKEANDIEFIETTDIPVENVVKEIELSDGNVIHRNVDTKNAPNVSQKTIQTTNEEYNEAIEDILLASSDDEVEENKETHMENTDPCVNLKDDNLSIGETVVEGIDVNETRDDENMKEGNKISQNETTAIEKVDNLDSLNNENMTDDNCVVLDDDCLFSEKVPNDNLDKCESNLTQAKCSETNEHDCVSLDDPMDENTSDNSGKNNDNDNVNENVDECVCLSDDPLSAEGISVTSSDDKRDNNESQCEMIESQVCGSKDGLNLNDIKLSTVTEGDNLESLGTNGDNIAAQSRNPEINEKVIHKFSLDDVNSPVCDFVDKNTEGNTNNGENADVNYSAESEGHNEDYSKSTNNSFSSLTENKPLNKDDAVDIGLENEEEVSEHVDDGNADVIRFELVTQVSTDTSANKVDELPNTSNVTEQESVLKENVENV